jgi:hypothetical protein
MDQLFEKVFTARKNKEIESAVKSKKSPMGFDKHNVKLLCYRGTVQ